MEPAAASLGRAPSRSSTAIGVLRAVHAGPGITRARLARELGISSGLASETVARLVGSCVVAEGPARATGGRGRPTASLGPHPRGPVAAVAAISHESWEVAIVALGGEVRTYRTQRHDGDRSSVFEGVEDALTGVCARHGTSVRAIAVSLPGTVSATRLVQAPNLGWQDVELSTAGTAHNRVGPVPGRKRRELLGDRGCATRRGGGVRQLRSPLHGLGRRRCTARRGTTRSRRSGHGR